jgi:hypothetical protein
VQLNFTFNPLFAYISLLSRSFLLCFLTTTQNKPQPRSTTGFQVKSSTQSNRQSKYTHKNTTYTVFPIPPANMRSTIFALATFMNSAAAHMIMASPVPFGGPGSKGPNNSPLDPSGSDYPCKFPGAPSSGGPMNQFKVGDEQTLSFSGSATHNGGSCQLAVTLDKIPTKNSKFKVIHSIEGGCPGVSGPSTFKFPVPSELPNGEATFAWTWFNKIGNREMYMNCAPITVSGGASDNTGFDSLPDMELANIAVGTGASCKTPESSDYTFKNPGKSVQRIGVGPFKELCGGAASAGGGGAAAPGGAQPSSGAGASPAAPAPPGGNDGKYTPSASAAAQTPAATSAAVLAPSASSKLDPITSTIRTLITVTSPIGAPTGNATAQVPASPTPSAQPSDPAAPSESAAPSAQPTAAPTAAPVSGGSTCSTDGDLFCNGDSQFGICNHGKLVWQAVAAGTACQNGKIAKRAFYAHRVQRNTY